MVLYVQMQTVVTGAASVLMVTMETVSGVLKYQHARMGPVTKVGRGYVASLCEVIVEDCNILFIGL